METTQAVKLAKEVLLGQHELDTSAWGGCVWEHTGDALRDFKPVALALISLFEQLEAAQQERDLIGTALGEPCAECGHIDWRSDGYGDMIRARLAAADEAVAALERERQGWIELAQQETAERQRLEHDLGAHRLMLTDERRWRAEAEKERDSWAKVAREYEAALAERSLL